MRPSASSTHEKTIDWADFLKRAEDALDTHGKARYIKRDLEAFRNAAT